MQVPQFSLRALLCVVLVSATLPWFVKRLKRPLLSGWGSSGILTSPRELPNGIIRWEPSVPSIGLYSRGFESDEPRAAIGFIRIQSNPAIVPEPGVEAVDRNTFRFGGKSWVSTDGQFKLVVIIDDVIEFVGPVDAPWVERKFRLHAKVTHDDVWKIVDFVGAR
ncbi:hypothetical protein CA85_32700 [Allorhodopirellula solitaria]|uniref:Uncharacterized protein n=1 Tax=Allorhodopirellula solitaria TaxID=2527987 RepID=A0A5C5XRR4_9BACT|nr:hypothetical protein CA85_32700 [Allorhodopirellula solitaria]